MMGESLSLIRKELKKSRRTHAVSCVPGLLSIFLLASCRLWTPGPVTLSEEPRVKFGYEWCANEFGKELFSAKLLGKKDKDGSIRLIWLFTGWHDQLAGVVIKRYQNGRWERLTKEGEMIRPGMIRRDWTISGMNAEQSRYFQAMQEKLLGTGRVKLLSQEEIMSFLRENGMRTGDRMRISRFNDSAFLEGFGAIDNSAVPAEKYAIFGMTVAGEEVTRPLAVWENKKVTPEVLELVSLPCAIKDNKVQIAWTLPKEIRHTWGIDYFNVYKSNGDSWEYLYHDFGSLDYVDKSSDPRQKQVYLVRPVNSISEELEGIEITYIPEKYGNLTSLSLTGTGNPSDQTVQLSWAIGPEDAGKIKFFKIERCKSFRRDKKILAERIPGNAPFLFSDKTEKKYGASYIYTVTAYLHNGSEETASAEIESPVPKAKLPAPKNFKVEIVKKGEKDYRLRFSWDPVPGARGYLFHHKNLARPNARYAQIGGCRKETSFEEEYPARHQTFVYSYGIQALSDDYSTIEDSELSVVENMKLIALRPEYVRDIVWSQNAGEVSLSWKNVDPTTTGLEIFINGESYQKLPPTATSLVIPEIKKTKNGDETGWVHIDIVNYNPMGKNKARCGFMYYVTPPEARKFPKIKNFQGRFVEKDGRRGIELTWDPVDLKKLNLTGYELKLYLRGATRGTEKLFSNYTKTEYFYPIPDDVKPGTELRFEIYVRRRINEKWPPTILRGPWVSARFMVK